MSKIFTDNKILTDFPEGPLSKYRNQASFKWREMQLFLENDDLLELKRKIYKIFETERIFEKSNNGMTRDEYYQVTMTRMLLLKNHHVFPATEYLRCTRKTVAITETLFHYDASLGVKFTYNGFFLTGLINLGTERIKKEIKQALNGKIIGCIAMTEMAHGTNTKGFQTTACYNPKTEEFVMNTPNFEAVKCWAGNLGKTCTHAIVYARLIINDVDYDVHPFLTPIRCSTTGLPYHGLVVGDLGEKSGLHAVDNGFLLFNSYKIPRHYLLSKIGDVTPDGKYISLQKTTSEKFSVAFKSLSAGRASIIGMTATLLSKAVIIAVRYAAVRKQFGPQNGEELSIIEYQQHQFRLFPYIACAYLLKEMSLWFMETLGKYLYKENKHDNPMEIYLGMEIHAFASAIKPLSSWTARDCIQECREACGGHGYLKASKLGDLRNDNDPNCTYDGDNNVLMQQTSKWLLKLYDNHSNADLMSPLKTASFIKHFDKILENKFTAESIEEATHPESLLKAYQWLICWLLKLTSNKMADLKRQKYSKFEARNNSQVFYASTLSIVFVQHFLLQHFYEKVLTCQDETIRCVLLRITSLYGAWTLDKHMMILYQGGYMTGLQPANLIRSGILQLCSSLKSDAVSLVDVLAPPDFVLDSPLGMSDGEIYKHLQSTIFRGNENESLRQNVINCKTSSSRL